MVWWNDSYKAKLSVYHNERHAVENFTNVNSIRHQYIGP